MAEPAAADIGGVEIPIRAALTQLESDLARAKQSFDKFDQSLNPKQLETVGRASKTTGAAFGDFEDQLGDTKKAQEEYNTVGNATVAALARQNAALAATVQRYGELEAAANDNTKAANDNSKGFATNAVEIAEWGNRIKIAAAAAYVLSPAIRSFVNPALTAATVAAGSAIKAIAPAAVSAGGALLTALGPGVSFLLRIALPITLAVEAVKLLSAAFEEGARKVEELTKQYDKIKSTDFSSIDFFNRQIAGAKELKINIDDMTGALVKFSEFSRSKSLGGSGGLADFVSTNTEAGNFPGLSDALKNVTETEDKLRIVNTYITKALESGQRLAALDLASKFYPPEVVRRLATTGTLLTEIQERADKIAQTDLVRSDNVILASQLKSRLDAAYESLSIKFIDFTTAGLQLQRIWVNILESTVGITNAVANIGGYIDRMISNFGNSDFWKWWNSNGPSFKLPGAMTGEEFLRQQAGPAPQQDAATAALSKGLSNPLAVSQAMNATLEIQSQVLGDASNAAEKYKNALKSITDAEDNTYKNEKKLKEAVDEINNAYKEGVTRLRAAAGVGPIDEKQLQTLKEARDTTIASLSVQKAAKDAWDRASEGLGQHTAAMKADAIAVGLGEGAQEKLRAEFRLLEAARQADRGVTDEQIAAYTKLRATMSAEQAMQEAGISLGEKEIATFQRLTTAAQEAAQAKAQATAEGKANFELATANLSGVEKEIAAIQYQLHGNGWEAFMQDGISATMRLTDGIKSLKSATDGFALSLVSNLLNGQKGFEALTGAAKTMISAMSADTIKRVQGGGSVFGSANLNSTQGAVGIAGAGLAGYQSGSALTGALGGALAGAAFGPVGAAVGGIVGALGGLFGGNAQKKQQEAAARAEAARQAEQTRLDAAARAADYTKQTSMIGLDTNKLPGALQALAIDRNSDLAAEAAKGNQAALELQTLYEKRRLDLLKNFNDAAIKVLSTDDPLSAVAQRLQDINDAAAQLSQGLQNLGQDTSVVADKVTAATAKLKSSFLDDLTKQLNAATGKSYLNDLADLVKATNAQKADAGLLGVDPAIIDRIFAASAQKIVDSTGLVGTAFNDLISVFPDLNSVVHQATTGIEDLRRSIDEYLNGLQLGQLSTLSQADQLQAAQAQFQSQMAVALSGTADAAAAQQGITHTADTLLQIARQYFGPSVAYGEIYNQITGQLRGLAGGGGTNLANTANNMALFSSLPSVASPPLTSGGTIGAAISDATVGSDAKVVVAAVQHLEGMLGVALDRIAMLEAQQKDATDEVGDKIDSLRTDIKQSSGEQALRQPLYGAAA